MIEQSIRTKALQSTALTSLIERNFHLTLNHNTDDNYVLLRVIDDPVEIDTHMQNMQVDATIQFDCFSKDPQRAKDISKALDNIFNKQGFKDTYLNVQLGLKQRRFFDVDTDSNLFRESSDYIFYYNEV